MLSSIIIYLIKSMLAMSLLYPLYRLLLKRETFHWLNRAVLLFILASCIALPAIDITTDSPNYAARKIFVMEETLAAVDLDGAALASDAAPAYAGRPKPHILAAAKWGAIAYLAVAALLLLRYLVSLLAFWRIAARSHTINAKATTTGRVLYNPAVATSCSWMRWIILNIAPDEPDFDLVLRHEERHVRLGHSWDMLACEAVARVLWILPFSWLLRRDLRDVHEYQADAFVMRTADADDRYPRLVIKHAFAPSSLSAANSFGDSSIKSRLRMMLSKRSSRIAAVKAAYLLPLLLFAATTFAHPAWITALQVDIDTMLPGNSDRAAFSHKPKEVKQIATARCTFKEYMAMPCKYQIEALDGETRITYLRLIRGKDEVVALAASDFCIYDEDTGDRYVCRGIDGYGDQVNINIKNYQKAVVPFTLTFPPLKPGVSTIRLLYRDKAVGDGAFKINDIRKPQPKIIR